MWFKSNGIFKCGVKLTTTHKAHVRQKNTYWKIIKLEEQCIEDQDTKQCLDKFILFSLIFELMHSIIHDFCIGANLIKYFYSQNWF